MAVKPGHARVVIDEVALGADIRYLAFGVRHQPKDSHAETVYEIAHRRLHGTD